MEKYRKMLNDWKAPYIQSLMRLIETQSKTTLANWCIGYAKERILPIYERDYPADARPRDTLEGAKDWLAGKVKLPEVKNLILNGAHAAAREADGNPAAQAAARTIGQCAATVHSARHCIGLAYYGALAVAYDSLGADASWAQLEQCAADECAKMEAALCALSVKNEPNPAKINWHH